MPALRPRNHDAYKEDRWPVHIHHGRGVLLLLFSLLLGAVRGGRLEGHYPHLSQLSHYAGRTPDVVIARLPPPPTT